MESPSILVICHEFPPLGGGAGKNLFLLCRELSRRGLKLRVLTGDPGFAKRLRFDFPVEYLGIGRRRRFETSLRGLFTFAVRAALKACPVPALGCGRLRDLGPPALVLSCLGIPAGIAGTFVSRTLRVPHVVWYHGSDVHGGRPSGPGRFQRALYRWVSRGATHNLYISAGLRDLAATLAPSRNASLLPSCPSPEIRAAAAAAPLSDGTSRYFLYLGRLEEVKNPLLLVRAIALLKAKGRPFPRLRMVGSGSLRDVVKAELRKLSLAAHATLEPAASHEQVPELLRGAHALIVPSRAEGFNTTILEAALFGVPTVGADTLGIRDFVAHQRTGLLFPGDDAQALADALAALAVDPALRDILGGAARAAADPYRVERMADDFLRAASRSAPALARFLALSPVPAPCAPDRGAAPVHSQETPA